MATRSTIALELADNSVLQVYCHYDGYPEHNGKILLNSYANPSLTADLVGLGDLSVLGNYISAEGKPHSFEQPLKDVCVYYGRDRGETGVEARRYTSYEQYTMLGQREEYNYIQRKGGEWFVDAGPGFNPLEQEILELEAKQYSL